MTCGAQGAAFDNRREWASPCFTRTGMGDVVLMSHKVFTDTQCGLRASKANGTQLYCRGLTPRVLRRQPTWRQVLRCTTFGASGRVRVESVRQAKFRESFRCGVDGFGKPHCLDAVGNSR